MNRFSSACTSIKRSHNSRHERSKTHRVSDQPFTRFGISLSSFFVARYFSFTPARLRFFSRISRPFMPRCTAPNASFQRFTNTWRHFRELLTIVSVSTRRPCESFKSACTRRFAKGARFAPLGNGSLERRSISHALIAADTRLFT